MSVPIDDQLWSAIGDPIRRQVLDILLASGPRTATGLGEQLPVTRQAVAKHLSVLDRAGLVTPSTVGREVRYAIDDAQFARAVAQLNAVGESWDRRLARIKRIAETIAKNQKQQPTTPKD